MAEADRRPDGLAVVAGMFSAHGLPWLVRLRWLAVVGQLSTCVLVSVGLGFELPWRILSCFLLATLATNALVRFAPRFLPDDPDLVCAGLLLQDTLVLAGMVWFTGGVGNPFTGFFLLHVVIAAVLLPRRWGWWILGVSATGLAAQYWSPHPLVAGRNLSILPADLARAGILVGLVLVGASVAFFVGGLRSAVRSRDEELEKARVRTARHERFAAVATLAAGVAHELATPLSTIAVVSSDFERLAGGHCGNGECISDARLIKSEVQRCRKILESLSDNATSGIGDPACVVDLASVPEKLRPFLRETNWIRLDFMGFQDAGQVVLPEPPFLQSIAALAKNACEASEGSVTVSVMAVADGVVLEVVDRGVGMEPATVARAGEPFFTTKGPGRGMGLGLFLVRTFVERVHGELEIESRKGEGSVFRMRLPREEGA